MMMLQALEMVDLGQRVINMLWIVIGIIWIFIIFVCLFGDYKEKELKEDYEKMKEICGWK